MTDISLPQGNNTYQEDVSTLEAGSTLVTGPCVVWSITAAVEADGDPIISFSNSEGYDATYRVAKIVLSTETKTVHLVFPKGLYCSTGLSATSNLASVDVSVTYD